MSAVLRIRKPARAGQTPADNPAKLYLDRLVKLIPAEVVGVYLAGKSLIQSKFEPDARPAAPTDLAKWLEGQQPYWLWWTIFCFVAVIVIRAWATSSGK